MEKEKLAWLAGITDGEGTITVFRNIDRSTTRAKDGIYEKYIATYSFANTDPAIVNEVQKILTELGVSSHIFVRTPLKEGHSAGICLSSRKMAHVKILLEAILPYLVGKKAQAELTLRFVKSRMERTDFIMRKKKNQFKSYTDEEIKLSEQLKSLNKKGRFKSSETICQTHLCDDIVRTAPRVAELITV